MSSTTAWRGIKSPMPHCKAFQKDVGDGQLTLFVGMEPDGSTKMKWHLSMSHRSFDNALAGRIPTWDEIKDARYKFCPDDVYMAMILPPMAEYVNLHPTTMHLHEVDG